ncbi:MAG TPA: hypothetical protein VFW96_20255 [Thermomicrobiales bacterium]|nr:hypothetical protein [Thermomicrobiales bacterium]
MLVVILAWLASACGRQHAPAAGHDARAVAMTDGAAAHDAPAPTSDAALADGPAGRSDGATADAPQATGDAARPDASPPVDAGGAPDAWPPMDAGSAPDASPPMDAGSAPDASPPMDAGSAPDAAGETVACYAQASPDAACTSPDHCCFSNFDAHHNGACTTSACSWGTIDCDGPEDCGAGQHCCSHAFRDPDLGTTGYLIACQSTACGAPPFDQELCHVSTTCPSGKTCVSAEGHDNDLPRALSICE